MILPGQRLPIVIATRPVDFRRGHDGLAATVQNELGLDPHSGLTVVFRSKRGDRLKILVWDGTGLVMIYKRLDQGVFAWPKSGMASSGSAGRNTKPCSRAWTGGGRWPAACSPRRRRADRRAHRARRRPEKAGRIPLIG